MSERDFEMVGVGLYTIPEAARLVGVNAQRIRRWVAGYKYRDRRGAIAQSEPLWNADTPSVDTMIGLSFLDMMEVRMVDAFRGYGVSWNVIRKAARYACDAYNDPHPFTMKKFLTDGRTIFAELLEGEDERVLNLINRQWVSKPIIQKSLFSGIDFEEGQAARWFPMKNHRVVLDPDRSFGRPIVTGAGVPTEVLFASYRTEGSISAVARWYEVPERDVRAAIQFENRFAA